MFETGVTDFVGGIASVFINLSAEYPAILDGILILCAFAGVIISSSAVFDIIRSGNRSNQVESTPRVVLAKFVGGTGLIDLAFWVKVWSASLWANSDVLDISSYSADSGMGGYANEALMAAIGIMVITGYVTLARAYFFIARLGHLSPESRSNMIGSITARIVAGTLLISLLHVSGYVQGSTGLKLITT